MFAVQCPGPCNWVEFPRYMSRYSWGHSSVLHWPFLYKFQVSGDYLGQGQRELAAQSESRPEHLQGCLCGCFLCA